MRFKTCQPNDSRGMLKVDQQDDNVVSTYSEHVYKDSFWVETCVIINYCAIFRCNANTSHHREQVLFILRFHTNEAVPHE